MPTSSARCRDPIAVEGHGSRTRRSLEQLHAYGMYLLGSMRDQNDEDETQRDLETVLTMKLTVASDLLAARGRFGEAGQGRDLPEI